MIQFNILFILAVLIVVCVIIYVTRKRKDRHESFGRKIRRPNRFRGSFPQRQIIKPENGDTAIGNGGQGKAYLTKKGYVRKIYYSRVGYDNNIKALKSLGNRPHIPKMYDYDPKKMSIVMEYCGDPLTADNCPRDVVNQLESLNDSLLQANISNTDAINKSNYTVKDNQIYLVDWGFISPGFKPINIDRFVERLRGQRIPNRNQRNQRFFNKKRRA